MLELFLPAFAASTGGRGAREHPVSVCVEYVSDSLCLTILDIYIDKTLNIMFKNAKL